MNNNSNNNQFSINNDHNGATGGVIADHQIFLKEHKDNNDF